MAMLSMAEYACGVTGENPHLPTPVNPIDPLAAVGGSSSGSGVAVASGLCYGSLGSDTAGSIRIPAATCGVLGLKPTTGLLPSEGTSPLAESLDTVGVMTRSALDAAQIFSALLTPTQRARLFPEPYPNSGVEANAQHLITRLAASKSLRIATCFAHPQPSFTPDEETLALLWQLALHYAGPKQPKEINLTSLSELIRCAEIMLHVEAAALHQGKLREKTHHLSDACRAVTLSGSVIPGVWYHHALKSRKAHMRAFVNAHFRDHDILLTPVLPHGVPDWSLVSTKSAEFKPRALIGLFSWTSFVNYLGLPAIVFPIGSDARGRPVCVQAIARPRAEALLLAFAHRVERDRYGCDGFIPQPSVLRPAHHLDK
jgi:aspartyl-tRNA(Asn)/glutamyl-tRNA(Gln) amidotransferase subunit A